MLRFPNLAKMVLLLSLPLLLPLIIILLFCWSCCCYHIFLRVEFYQSMLNWRNNLFIFMRISMLKRKLESDLKFLSTFFSLSLSTLMLALVHRLAYAYTPIRASKKMCRARVLSLVRYFLFLLLSTVFSLSSNLSALSVRFSLLLLVGFGYLLRWRSPFLFEIPQALRDKLK